MKKTFFITGFALLIASCATPARQTELLLGNPPSHLPLSHEIPDVAFVDQSSGYCGPATLTMAMQFAKQSVTVDEVATLVYTPGMKGSLQTDLISASRRQGLMAVQINSLQALLSEIAAGHPVIIFENLALSWAPNWHYAFVFGYDLNSKEMIMHSGHDAFYRWDMKKFERSWMLGDYWGLVVMPAGDIAISAGEIANLTSAVGLEQTKKTVEAEKSYRAILKKWPSSLVALIGLANITHSDGRRNEAISLLRLALKHHPDSKAAQNNLAIAEAK